MSTAIAGKKLSTKRAEWDVRRRARQSKDHPDCRSTTIKSRVTKISLALSPCRDKYPLAATAKMAILIVAVFPSRLSRYSVASDVVPKFVSPSDPAAQWTGAHKGPAFFAYSDNYLIDVKFGVIVDVEASR